VSCDSACCLKSAAPIGEKTPAVPNGSFVGAKDLIRGSSSIFVTIRAHVDIVFHPSAPLIELLPPRAPLYLRHLAQLI
jgi:hypothetical protein